MLIFHTGVDNCVVDSALNMLNIWFHAQLILFAYILKDATIRAGSVLGGKTGKKASTSPKRKQKPDTSTTPVNEGKRKPAPKNDLTKAAMESKLLNIHYRVKNNSSGTRFLTSK